MSTLLKAGDKVWVTTRDGDKAATVHSGCWHEGEFWYCLTDLEGMPARPGRKGWRARPSGASGCNARTTGRASASTTCDSLSLQ